MIVQRNRERSEGFRKRKGMRERDRKTQLKKKKERENIREIGREKKRLKEGKREREREREIEKERQLEKRQRERYIYIMRIIQRELFTFIDMGKRTDYRAQLRTDKITFRAAQLQKDLLPVFPSWYYKCSIVNSKLKQG